MEALNPTGDVPQKYALLCPVRAVRIYVQKTQGLRKDYNLFLSYDHKHLGCKMSSNTISRWIKEVILIPIESVVCKFLGPRLKLMLQELEQLL